MLVDSFERVVGTPEVQGYSELVLYAYSDTQALLERYEDGGLESERMTAYLVPIEAAADALTAIRDAGMDDWNRRRDTAGICGKLYVCRYRMQDGTYNRVSSEQMPQDGIAAFGAVRAALSAYLKEEYRR